MTDWMKESLYPEYAQALSIDELLYDSETEHQRLKVFQNNRFGRVLTLDDVVQTTEGDNFIYHEMLTHVPILAHGAAKRVLIIGGGDGGMAREVLRHASVEHVTMVEIDAGVVEFSKTYLPTLSQGAFDDPRLNLVIADGADFMKAPGGTFDVIIVDSTDPIGPGEVLFTDTFYGHAKAALTPGGILVTQNGVPFLQGGRADQYAARLQGALCRLGLLPGHRAHLCRRADGLWLGHRWRCAAGGSGSAGTAVHGRRDRCGLLYARGPQGRLRPARLRAQAAALKR